MNKKITTADSYKENDIIFDDKTICKKLKNLNIQMTQNTKINSDLLKIQILC